VIGKGPPRRTPPRLQGPPTAIAVGGPESLGARRAPRPGSRRKRALGIPLGWPIGEHACRGSRPPSGVRPGFVSDTHPPEDPLPANRPVLVRLPRTASLPRTQLRHVAKLQTRPRWISLDNPINSRPGVRRRVGPKSAAVSAMRSPGADARSRAVPSSPTVPFHADLREPRGQSAFADIHDQPAFSAGREGASPTPRFFP